MTPMNTLINNIREAAANVETAYARAKRNAGALQHATRGEAARDDIAALTADEAIGPLMAKEAAALKVATDALVAACPMPSVPAVVETPETR